MSHSHETTKRVFVRVPDAARMLDMGLTATWEMVRAGTLPSKRFGRSVRIPVAAIEQMAAETAAAN